MPLSRPPDNETLTIFSLAFVMAGLGALMKILLDGVKRTPKQIATKILIMSFWGGVYGWAITAQLTLSPEALAASSVVIGYAGYEVTISLIMRLLNPTLAQALGLDRRKPPAQTRKDDDGTPLGK